MPTTIHISPLTRPLRLRSFAPKTKESTQPQAIPPVVSQWPSLAHRYAHTVDFHAWIEPLLQNFHYWFGNLVEPESIECRYPIACTVRLGMTLDYVWSMRQAHIWPQAENPIRQDQIRRTRRFVLTAMTLLARVDTFSSFDFWLQTPHGRVSWSMQTPWTIFLQKYHAPWYVKKRNAFDIHPNPFTRWLDDKVFSFPHANEHWKKQWALWSQYRASTDTAVRYLASMLEKARQKTQEKLWGRDEPKKLPSNGHRQFQQCIDAALAQGHMSLAIAPKDNPWIWLEAGLFLRWDRFIDWVERLLQSHHYHRNPPDLNQWLLDLQREKVIITPARSLFYRLVDTRHRYGWGANPKVVRLANTRYWLGRFWFYAQQRKEKTRYMPIKDCTVIDPLQPHYSISSTNTTERIRWPCHCPEKMGRKEKFALQKAWQQLDESTKRKCIVPTGVFLPQSLFAYEDRDPLLMQLLAFNMIVITEDGRCLFAQPEHNKESLWEENALGFIIKARYFNPQKRNENGLWERIPWHRLLNKKEASRCRRSS